MSGGIGAARPITFVGTSAAFQSTLRAAVATIPEAIWSPVAAAGVQVYGARLVSDGGILGYDDRDGAYRRVRAGSTGRLVVAEYTQTLAGESLTPDPTAMGRNSPGLPDFRQYFPKSAEFVEDIIRQRKATP